MSIEIRQEEAGEFRVLALAGRLDTETSADLELALQDLQAAGATRFLIEMADISYVSSAGLRVLLALAKQLEGGRGTLRLCALNDAVKQVFDVAGFSRMFAIFPNRAAALGSAAPAAAAAPAAGLAKKAAKLLGAPESTPPPTPASADIARAAAKLLGAEKAVSPPAKAVADKLKQAEMPVPAAPEKKPADPSGVLGKVRSLFGGKKQRS
jgi:anti-sigma B factor antagonist